ncbi:hypothetical protein, partial [Daeguia caeni]
LDGHLLNQANDEAYRKNGILSRALRKFIPSNCEVLAFPWLADFFGAMCGLVKTVKIKFRLMMSKRNFSYKTLLLEK